MSGRLFENAKEIDSFWSMGLAPEFTVALDKMASQAAALGGACIKRFNQSDHRTDQRQGFRPFIRKHQIPGVCTALSLYWIMYHAKGRDFWGWLYGEPDIASPVPYICLCRNPAEEIVDRQLKINQPDAPELVHGRHVMGAEKFLRLNGIERLHFGHYGLAKTEGLAASMAATITQDFGKRVVRAGRYILLRFCQGRNEHVCALWLSNDVTYFDSNYGEFWFPTAQAFREWFFHYWDAAFYRKDCGEYYGFTSYSPRNVPRY